MKIIYHCYGGTHSSVTAAGIHLGLLPRDRVPERRELTSLKFFDHQDPSDVGKFFLMGKDSRGNEVYVVGRRSRPKLLYNVTEGLCRLFGIDQGSMLLVDVSSFVSTSMRAGGFMSRKMGLVRLGRPIVTWGTLRNYTLLADVVEKVFSSLGEATEKRTASRPVQVRNTEAAC